MKLQSSFSVKKAKTVFFNFTNVNFVIIIIQKFFCYDLTHAVNKPSKNNCFIS